MPVIGGHAGKTIIPLISQVHVTRVCLLARRPPDHARPSEVDGGALGQADLTLRGGFERIPTMDAALPHLSGGLLMAWGLWE